MLDYPAFVSICSALHRWTMTKNVVNKPPHRPGSLKCPDDFCVVYSASSRGEFNGKITFRKFRQNLRPAARTKETYIIVLWLVISHIYSNLQSLTDDFRWLIPARSTTFPKFEGYYLLYRQGLCEKVRSWVSWVSSVLMVSMLKTWLISWAYIDYMFRICQIV